MDVEAISYRPPPEFEEDPLEQLVDVTLSNSTELFLIQWPLQQHPEIDGKEFTLQLNPDGKLGSLIDSTGEAYDLVSTASKEPETKVILSSESQSKFVGKISRRVSLVHYKDPEEYKKLRSDKKLMHQKSSGTLMANSSNPFATPMQSKGLKISESLGRTMSTHNSRHKSSFSGTKERSKSSKRKHGHESTGSMNQPAQSQGTTPFSGLSEHGGAHESTGSMDRSLMNKEGKKSKKKVKNEE